MPDTGTAPETLPQSTPPPQATPLPDAPPISRDHDDVALAAAAAEVAKLDGGAPAPAPSTETQPEPAAAKPGPKPGARVSVPRQAFDGVLTAAQKLREENADLKARLEERRAIEAERPEMEPEPEPQVDHAAALREELQQVNTERLEVEQQYEDGKITGKERMTQLIALEQRAAEINSATILAGVGLVIAQANQNRGPDPASAAAADVVDAYKRQIGTSLNQQYPYMANMNQPQLEWLASFARQEAATAGQPYGDGLTEDVRIWNHIGQLTERFGPAMLPNFRPPPKGQQPAAGQPSPAAAARNGKLDLAARQPPSLNGLGQSAPGRAGTSADQFMSTPMHMLDKLTLKDLEKIQF